MKIYLSCTANLGDFLNSFPVLSGIVKKHGKIDLIVKSGLKKFKGFKQFLLHQELFSSVEFDDEIFLYGDIIQLSSWTREDKNNPNRPIETCRYENWLKDNYNLDFDVDDDFIIKVPSEGILPRHAYHVGDRWSVADVDTRRKTGVLSHLTNVTFINYDNDLLTNAYTLKHLSLPFITNLTGIAVLADLLNIESYVVWKPEDWNPEFIIDGVVRWDDGKDINKVFEKHFYLNRKTKLVHADNLEKLIDI